MSPITIAILTSWDWRIEVLLPLFLLGTIYIVGWSRLRRRTNATHNRWRAGALWRPFSYIFGLIFIGIALMSPLDVLASSLFFMHMIQHLLLIMIAPPLLLLANPMAFLLWGLPGGIRIKAGRFLSRLLNRNAPSRRWLQKATTPAIVWLFWFIAIIGWHDVNAYNAALTYGWVHDVEHLSFFAAGMLFWWHVTGAGPRLHKQFGLAGRIAFTLSAVPPNMLTGVVLTFLTVPVYTYYLDVPRVWGISPLVDQQIGGLIMWIPGSMMYLIAVLILIARLLSEDS